MAIGAFLRKKRHLFYKKKTQRTYCTSSFFVTVPMGVVMRSR